MRRAIHPHSLPGATLPFAPSQSPLHRGFPVHGFHYVRKPDACTPPGCDVPPEAHYPERHRDARSKSRQRALRVPANRARYSEFHPVRSSVTALPTHRCPWPQSNNRRSSVSPTDGPEFRGRPRCVPDKRADPGKLPPKDFRTPCAAVAPRFLRRRETEAPQVNVSHSSASES